MTRIQQAACLVRLGFYIYHEKRQFYLTIVMNYDVLEKQLCFKCKQEFGPDSKKIGINDFVIARIPIPNGFALTTKICTSCFNLIKKDTVMNPPQPMEFPEERGFEPQPMTAPKVQTNNVVIQFKNENIAILQKSIERNDEFISAFDSLTKEGYRLMSIGDGNSYFYFQRVK